MEYKGRRVAIEDKAKTGEPAFGACTTVPHETGLTQCDLCTPLHITPAKIFQDKDDDKDDDDKDDDDEDDDDEVHAMMVSKLFEDDEDDEFHDAKLPSDLPTQQWYSHVHGNAQSVQLELNEAYLLKATYCKTGKKGSSSIEHTVYSAGYMLDHDDNKSTSAKEIHNYLSETAKLHVKCNIIKTHIQGKKDLLTDPLNMQWRYADVSKHRSLHTLLMSKHSLLATKKFMEHLKKMRQMWELVVCKDPVSKLLKGITTALDDAAGVNCPPKAWFDHTYLDTLNTRSIFEFDKCWACNEGCETCPAEHPTPGGIDVLFDSLGIYRNSEDDKDKNEVEVASEAAHTDAETTKAALRAADAVYAAQELVAETRVKGTSPSMTKLVKGASDAAAAALFAAGSKAAAAAVASAEHALAVGAAAVKAQPAAEKGSNAGTTKVRYMYWKGVPKLLNGKKGILTKGCIVVKEETYVTQGAQQKKENLIKYFECSHCIIKRMWNLIERHCAHALWKVTMQCIKSEIRDRIREMLNENNIMGHLETLSNICFFYLFRFHHLNKPGADISESAEDLKRAIQGHIDRVIKSEQKADMAKILTWVNDDMMCLRKLALQLGQCAVGVRVLKSPEEYIKNKANELSGLAERAGCTWDSTMDGEAAIMENVQNAVRTAYVESMLSHVACDVVLGLVTKGVVSITPYNNVELEGSKWMFEKEECIPIVNHDPAFHEELLKLLKFNEVLKEAYFIVIKTPVPPCSCRQVRNGRRCTNNNCDAPHQPNSMHKQPEKDSPCTAPLIIMRSAARPRPLINWEWTMSRKRSLPELLTHAAQRDKETLERCICDHSRLLSLGNG